MALWRFFDYVTEDEENLIGTWYDAQDPAIQAQFDTTLLILAGISDWEDDDVEQFKPLVDAHAGLGEIRFHVDQRAQGAKKATRRRFRPVGPWPPVIPREFVMILGCEEKRSGYIPPRAFDIALGHKTALEAGRGRTSEHPLE